MGTAVQLFAKFEYEFNRGERNFCGVRLPLVVIRGDQTHICTRECELLCLDAKASLFVCPRTLKPHYCGWGICTAEYEVGPEGKVCCLTGNVVDDDASILSHGWLEDTGRRRWDGVATSVGGSTYAEVLRPGDDGFVAAIRPVKRARHRAPAPRPPAPPQLGELKSCVQAVRDIFPGSQIRTPYECIDKSRALTKAICAIERYVRTKRSHKQSVSMLKVATLFRRHCARLPRVQLIIPDDDTIHLLAIGYSKVGIDFLTRLWVAAKIPPPQWQVALIALLYLQKRGIEINGTRVLGADVLLRAWLPEANMVSKFSVDKSAFTAAKNTIQRAVRELHNTHTPVVRLKQYTVTQLLRIGASEREKNSIK